VKIAVFVTAASLVIGYPIAYFISQLRGTAMTIGLAFVLLPFWTSVLVRNYAWFVMLSRNGVINSSLIGLGLTSQPFALLFNTLAVTIGMTYVLVPFMILSLLSVMRGISSSYLRASASLGASRTETFWRVYFPLSKPGVYAGCLLVFITSIGFFITPALLGGGRVPMIAVLIESQVRGVLNFGVGSALGTLLLAIVLILYYIFDRVLGVETMFGSAR
jgi:putative spermidine/putrescine transport system permease protein